MNAIKLQKLNLPEDLLERIKADLRTPAAILQISNRKFQKLGFDLKEVQLIRNSVLPLPKLSTVAECINVPHRWKRIRFGCKALDEILGNGISTVGITEISGESGSGKSQICLQLAISVQLPEHLGGLGKGAVYICTENSMPTSRLCEISDYFKNHYRQHINFTDNIFVDHVYDVDNLLECVSNRLPRLMEHNRIGIIIIDSVAAPFRIVGNLIHRTEKMRELAHLLLKLSDKHHCAVVVCVNQVASIINDSNNHHPSDNQFTPCLGLAWVNLVNTRLQIHRTNKSFWSKNNEHSTTPTPYTVRNMKVIFAPDLKQDSADFLITSNGVSDISDYF